MFRKLSRSIAFFRILKQYSKHKTVGNGTRLQDMPLGLTTLAVEDGEAWQDGLRGAANGFHSIHDRVVCSFRWRSGRSGRAIGL